MKGQQNNVDIDFSKTLSIIMHKIRNFMISIYKNMRDLKNLCLDMFIYV